MTGWFGVGKFDENDDDDDLITAGGRGSSSLSLGYLI